MKYQRIPEHIKLKHYQICKRILPTRNLGYATHLPKLNKKQALTLREFLEGEMNLLLICGVTGTGKTCLGSSIVSTHILGSLKATEKPSVTYEFCYNFYLNMRNYKSLDFYEADKYFTSKLLVLDDFGASKLSEYQVEVIQQIITERESENKKTVIITNNNMPNLSKLLQDPLIRRINEGGILEI